MSTRPTARTPNAAVCRPRRFKRGLKKKARYRVFRPVIAAKKRWITSFLRLKSLATSADTYLKAGCSCYVRFAHAARSDGRRTNQPRGAGVRHIFAAPERQHRVHRHAD